MLSPVAGIVFTVLAAPGFEQVRLCDPVPSLPWETWLYAAPESDLLTQEVFMPESGWGGLADPSAGGAAVRTCFGTATPHDRYALLHRFPLVGEKAEPRPVLLVGGANDHAIHGLTFLAGSLAREGFETWALTFAHPHGDNFAQAEQIAGALAEVRALTGAEKVDVVAYSKGGTAARIYASHLAAEDFAGVHDTYATLGTRFRGDIGKLVFVGVAQAGVDTIFRWSAGNFASLGLLGTLPLSAPGSWTTYYPNTTANIFTAMDYTERCVTGDAFVGQAQLLADLREMHALPGGNPMLGVYAEQPDYLTTYIGGLGFVSDSPGIEAAIARGGGAGGVIARLQQTGIAPEVELYLVAGGNPILSLGSPLFPALETGWENPDQVAAGWSALVDAWLGGLFPWYEQFGHDLPRLYAGRAWLGEISGPSDGLVFLGSALDDSGLVQRGAVVREAHTFEALAHTELVVAGTLASTWYGDPAQAGLELDVELAAKYALPENQSVEWIIEALRSGAGPVPSDAGPAGEDATVADAGADVEPEADAVLPRESGGPTPDARPAEPSADGAWPIEPVDGTLPPVTADAGTKAIGHTSDGCGVVPPGGSPARGPLAGFAVFLFMFVRRRSMSGVHEHGRRVPEHRR